MTTRTKNQSAAVLAGNHGFSLISDEKLLQLYSAMMRCRMIGERVRVLLGQDKAVKDDAVGQEATVVGVTADLLAEDSTGPSYPDFMVKFIRGVPLDEVFRTLLGGAGPGQTKSDRTKPDQTSPHRMPLAIDAQLNAAASLALKNKQRKNGKVVVAFTGGGTIAQGSWQKAFRLAGSRKAPIVFVAQNRRTPKAAGPMPQAEVEDFVLDAQACGLPCIPVDPNDVVAVYRVATEAIAQARKGNGPTLIECVSGEGFDHSSIGPGKARDPIQNMETYLSRKGLSVEGLKGEVAVSFTRELNAAIEAAKD